MSLTKSTPPQPHARSFVRADPNSVMESETHLKGVTMVVTATGMTDRAKLLMMRVTGLISAFGW